MKYLILTGGGKTKVDDDIYEKYHKFSWHVDQSKRNYVVTSIKKKTVRLSRLIMGATTGQMIDHIDGNTHNNLRSNLRFATGTQNQGNRKLNKNNTSGYRGVTWNWQFRNWVAQIRRNGKLHLLGVFGDKKKAALAYNKAAKEYFGEFATLNEL